MAVVPHTIGIVVAEMAASMKFYGALGLVVPEIEPGQEQVQIITPGGAALGFVAESAMRAHNPHWVTPVGQRVTFACRCDNAAELDAVYVTMKDGGFTGLREPWDAFWGQRYAFLGDPDGNRVDLFAALSEAGEE